MEKHLCPESECKHVASQKGFCPTHGSALVDEQTKAAGGKKQEKGFDLEAVLKSVDEAVGNAVAKKVKEFGLDNPGRNMNPETKMPANREEKLAYVKGLLNNYDKAELEIIDEPVEQKKFLGKARIGYFFKHAIAFAIDRDPVHLPHIKALSEGDNASGGYLVPKEFRAQLIMDMKDEPFLRNLVTVIPMATDYLEMPSLTSDVKVSWGTENASIATTTARFGQLTFAPKRLEALMYTSRELVADSALAVIQLISRLFMMAIGREEDRVIVNGTGSGQPKGILAETLAGIDNHNSAANVADNIRKLPFTLPKAYRQNGQWLINGQALSAISVLKDTQNRPLIGNLADSATTKLCGYDINEQNDMPINHLLFGDFSHYYLADRQQMAIETTVEGAGTFEKHQVAIKIIERLDGKVAIVNAFRKLSNAGFNT